MISQPFINGGVGDQGIGNQVGYAGLSHHIIKQSDRGSSKQCLIDIQNIDGRQPSTSNLLGSLGLLVVRDVLLDLLGVGVVLPGPSIDRDVVQLLLRDLFVITYKYKGQSARMHKYAQIRSIS